MSETFPTPSKPGGASQQLTSDQRAGSPGLLAEARPASRGARSRTANMVSQIPGPGATALSSEERKLLSTGEEGAYQAARCDAGTGVHAPADFDLGDGVLHCTAWRALNLEDWPWAVEGTDACVCSGSMDRCMGRQLMHSAFNMTATVVADQHRPQSHAVRLVLISAGGTAPMHKHSAFCCVAAAVHPEYNKSACRRPVRAVAVICRSAVLAAWHEQPARFLTLEACLGACASVGGVDLAQECPRQQHCSAEAYFQGSQGCAV